ncbi:Hypothetical predicted protein [Olea europaea subsp. europaea]|uniref:Uncharacterized protein n=1 Tax=Olea europaea subsp. europaea TaxID=158383 RepID=A0A8S0QHW0_OLEEU|nr:Hypothetical predicted protein [Olea europaea subsp. europaea]
MDINFIGMKSCITLTEPLLLIGDVGDTKKMPGYEPNPGNTTTIPEVDYEENYVEEDLSEEYNPTSYSAIDPKPNPEEKERKDTWKND